MKKLVAIVLAAMLLMTGCSTKAPEATGGMKAGTYKATAAGFHGDITLEVTVDAEKITDIQILEQTETEGIGAAALPELVTKVLDNQTLGIDGISGATVTSNGFKTAMEDALTQAGADMDKMTKPVESSSATKEEVTLDADIVVVGGGAAGLTAALSSQQNGNSVILLEKTGVVGGASAMAGAGTMATGSQWQKEDGYEDSPEQLKADMLKNGHNNNDEATLDIYVNTTGAAFDWLVSEDGANVPYQRDGKPTRSYSGQGRGAGVVSSLSESFTTGGGTLMTNTPATELIVEDGVVKGVKASDETKNYTINAKAVILATGGFGANGDMVKEYNTYWPAIPEGIKTTNVAGATGDGIELGLQAKASLTGMGMVQLMPTASAVTGQLADGLLVPSQYYMFVNQEGNRFVNEYAERDVLASAALSQTDGVFYHIADQNMIPTLQNKATQEQVDAMAEKGILYKADSLEALAEQIGCPSENLIASVDKYNSYVDAGNDPDFGKNVFGSKIETAPFYAVIEKPSVHHTMGGLTINTEAQVLNEAGEAIQGLYAAGEVTGGIHGGNRVGGNAIADIMVFGRIAGANAAK